MSEGATRTQSEIWNEWNSMAREHQLEPRSERHARIITAWLEDFGRRDLRILEAGCGAGWMAARMRPYGAVTGVDLADEVLDRARAKWPEVTFIAGDFLDVELPEAAFDAVVSLEVLSHVADQPGYIAKIARLLKPGGQMLMATQNRPVLERNKLPPAGGWLRRWVDRRELAEMTAPHMVVRDMFTVEPSAKEGVARYLTAGKVMRIMNLVTLGAYKAGLERAGLGWSIMCRAEKPI